MVTTYEIPLTATPQIFGITILGVSYRMQLIFRDAIMNGLQAGGWILDIFDALDNPLVFGIPLVTGIDLLGQYQYLDIGVQLFAETDNNPTVPPSFTSLGTTSHLYFVTP